MSTTAEKNVRWEAGVKMIAFNFNHLLLLPIHDYFRIDLLAHRQLIFHSYHRMNTIPRNELIALYDLVYYY